MWLAAVVAPKTASVTETFASYGVLGAIALIALAAAVKVWLTQEKRIDQANERADRIAAEKDALTKDVMKDVIPVLTKVVEVMTESVELQRRERR